MTEDEKVAVAVADEFVGHISLVEKVKYLGTEYAELCMAIQEGDPAHIEEELGDMGYILLHIASKYDRGLQELIDKAVEKMVMRQGMKKR